MCCPIALFAALLFTLNKLNGDSELIVLSSVGLDPLRLLRPFAVLMAAVFLLVGAMSLWIMPASFAELRSLLSRVRTDFLARVVREGQFSTLDRGFVFHYRERGPGGALLGIFMQDRRDPERINTYIAETGATIESGSDNFLVLEKGSVQRQTRGGGDPVMVVFDSYAIDLSQFGTPGGDGAPLKPRERSTMALVHPDMNDPMIQRNYGAFRAELHDRLVNPIYALVFGMVAFAALARARTTRQGRGTAMLGAIVTVVAVRVAGFGIAALAAKQTWAVFALYGFPLSAVALAAWYAFGDPEATFSRLRLALPGRLRMAG